MILDRRFYTILILIVLCMACDKEPTRPDQSDHKDFLDFRMETIHNKEIVADDVIGVIHNDTIKLTIPQAVELSHLISTFSTSGQAV